MAEFGSSFIIVHKTWSALKTVLSEKRLPLQYDELTRADGDVYELFAVDEVIVYLFTIWKGSVPDGFGVSQAQNDSDKTDFETNYKPTGNQKAKIAIPSAGNSSVIPLAANASFIGVGEDVSNIVSIDVTVLADQVSAVNGLLFEWSEDNVTFGYSESFTIQPNHGEAYSFSPRAKFFRVTITNGLTAQTSLTLSTTYYPLSRSIYGQSLATVVPYDKAADVVRSVLAAQKSGSGTNEYLNLQATVAGILKVSVETVVYPDSVTPSVVQKNNTGPAFATSISTAFTSNVKLGTTLIVVVIEGQGTFNIPYTLADTRGNSYAKAAATVAVTPSGSSISVWYATSASAGACTVSAINFSPDTNLAMQIYEVSDILTVSNPVDKIAAVANVGTSLSVGPVVTGANGEFCIAAYGADIASLITPGAGWTSDLSVAGFGCFSQVQSAAGSLTGTATAASSVNSIDVLVTFLPKVSSKPLQTDADGKLYTKSQFQFDDGGTLTAGQKAMTASMPVVIASDQSPVLVAGLDGSSVAQAPRTYDTDAGGGVENVLGVVLRKSKIGGSVELGTNPDPIRAEPTGNRQTIHNSATITASGSAVVDWLGWSEWYLIINIKDAPTGTTPSITFKIEEVDPIDQTTVVGETITGAALTAVGVEVLPIVDTHTDTFKISWTVTGTTPSFTGVNVTFVGHAAGNAIEGQAEVGSPLEEAPVPVAGVDNSNNVQTLRVDPDGNLQVVVNNISSNAVVGISTGMVQLGGATAGTLNVVRATAYIEPSSNAQRSIKSSSASDSSAGVGARTLEITYLDSTGAGPYTEVVTLNGTTAVNTVATNICFIEKVIVKTVGSTLVNVGTISLYTTTGGGGTVIGTIGVGNLVAATGDNRTLWGHHYVPTGKTASLATYIISAESGGSGTNATFFFRSTALPVSSNAEVVISDLILVTGPLVRQLAIPIRVIGPAKVVAYGIPGGNNVRLNASFDFSELPT
jgi:hypothetical protein